VNTLDRTDRSSVLDDAPASRMEFIATIRGSEVSCWLESGRLRGDPALLRRLALAGVPTTSLDVVTLARLVGDAVGSHVTLRFREPPLRRRG